MDHEALSPDRRLSRLSAAAAILVFVLLVLSAYIRLRAAGLGCPDWPGCYGRLPLPPTPRWATAAHRLVAGLLGLMVLALAAAAWRGGGRRERLSALALLGLTAALAALGLKTPAPAEPWVTLGNVAGAMLMLALLVSLGAAQRPPAAPPQGHAGDPLLRRAALAGVILLWFVIALGAWLSANYAATACPGLPDCGTVWREHVSWEVFDLTRRLAVAGGAIQPPADAPFLHMLHRFAALAALFSLGALALYTALRPPRDGGAVRRASLVLLALLGLQASLGLALVALGLPLAAAVAHNAGAALALAAAVYWSVCLTCPDRAPPHRADPPSLG